MGADAWYCQTHDTQAARDLRHARTARESRDRVAARLAPELTLSALEQQTVKAHLLAIRALVMAIGPMVNKGKLAPTNPAVVLVRDGPTLLDSVLAALEP